MKCYTLILWLDLIFTQILPKQTIRPNKYMISLVSRVLSSSSALSANATHTCPTRKIRSKIIINVFHHQPRFGQVFLFLKMTAIVIIIKHYHIKIVIFVVPCSHVLLVLAFLLCWTNKSSTTIIYAFVAYLFLPLFLHTIKVKLTNWLIDRGSAMISQWSRCKMIKESL